MNSNLDVIGNLCPKLDQHRPWLFDRPRPVGFELVPVGRQPKDFPRIAGTERADEDVVNLLRVLDDDELGVLEKADPEFFSGGATVGEQPRAKVRVNPSPRDQLGAKRRVAGIHHFEHAPDFAGAYQLLLDQQFPHRRLHDLVLSGLCVGRFRDVRMVVTVRSHRQLLSSQVSKTSIHSPSFGEPA